MEKITGIYKITSPSGKVYVGQSADIHERWKYYRCRDYKNQRKLFNSLKKYGVDKHSFEIIEECLIEMLNEREVYWGLLYDSINKGLNLVLGNSHVMSDETRKKKSDLMKGRKMPDHLKEKLRKINTGRKHTEEHIAKRVSKLIGRKRSDETRKKLSEKARGRVYSEEALLSRKGRKLTETTKQKLRDINLGKKHSEESKRRMSEALKGKGTKSIICINTGEIFDSAGEASSKFNINRSGIVMILKGKIKNPRHGLLFGYKN